MPDVRRCLRCKRVIGHGPGEAPPWGTPDVTVHCAACWMDNPARHGAPAGTEGVTVAVAKIAARAGASLDAALDVIRAPPKPEPMPPPPPPVVAPVSDVDEIVYPAGHALAAATTAVVLDVTDPGADIEIVYPIGHGSPLSPPPLGVFAAAAASVSTATKTAPAPVVPAQVVYASGVPPFATECACCRFPTPNGGRPARCAEPQWGVSNWAGRVQIGFSTPITVGLCAVCARKLYDEGAVLRANDGRMFTRA